MAGIQTWGVLWAFFALRGMRVVRLSFWVVPLCLGACRQVDQRPASATLRVFVSILPQAYFVERVGGDHVTVDVLIGPGQSPTTYAPTPQQMARLGEAQVYFRIGVPFEDSLLKRISTVSKPLRVVDLRDGVQLREMEDPHEHDSHATDAGDGRERGGGPRSDPHVWLDPMRVKIMARTICEEFGRLDPAHAPVFSSNLEAFGEQLEAADRRIAKILAPFRGRRFYVFHPSYGYFAERYGLQQVAVETGGKQPSARELGATIEKARTDGVKVIFIQPQFSKSAAEAVAGAVGGTVEPLDPLARDYVANLGAMAARIAAALTR